MEMLNVLAHPVDNIQNSLKVVLPKLYGLKDLLKYVSHDTLLIRKFPKLNLSPENTLSMRF